MYQCQFLTEIAKTVVYISGKALFFFAFPVSVDEYRPACLALKQTTDNTFNVVWKPPR